MATGIKKTLRANIIPLIAIMTAVTTVLTMFVKIPTPTRGYLNLSDTMIFFSAYAFGPWVGGIVGGLGPALSDLISGYPQWAIFTFVIDGLQAVIAGLIIREFKPFNIIAGSLVAGVWLLHRRGHPVRLRSGAWGDFGKLLPDGGWPDCGTGAVFRRSQSVSAVGANGQSRHQDQ